MTLIFRNGGSNYVGETFDTETVLLQNLRDWLQLAGWTIRDDFINESKLLVMQGNAIDNNDTCFIEFRSVNEEGVLNGKILQIKGDIDGSGSILSDPINFKFINNSTNIIYLTADDDSLALFIESNDGSFNNGHFGFLDRLDPNSDTFGWMVGRIDWRVNNSFWAKSYHNGTDWRKVGDDYWYSDTITSYAGRATTPYQGLIDRYTTHFKFIYDNYRNWDDDRSFHNSDNKNIGYYFYNGALNPVNNLPVIGEMFYLEGLGSQSNYGSNAQGDYLPPQLYYRGTVKHCVIGLASTVVKTQVIDKEGNRYLSVGGKGYQGMRIA